MGDVALGLPVMLGVAMLFTIGALVAFGEDNEPALLAIGAAGQFGATLAWPWIVTRWKGRRSLRLDFRFEFRWIDLAIGLGLAVAMLIVGTLVALGVSRALGIDTDEGSNTALLEDNEHSPWIWLIAFVVVFVGPVAEELFFRGLTLRALHNRWGQRVAIIGSAVIFTLPHITTESIEGQILLWSQIIVWALIWAVAAVRLNRLGANVVSHMLVNGIATAVALWA